MSSDNAHNRILVIVAEEAPCSVAVAINVI